MTVNTVTKIALSMSGVAGISSAIGAPVLLRKQSISAWEDEAGIPKVEIFKDLEKCSEENEAIGESISFGNTSKDKVCGKIESSRVSSVSLNEERNYTQLFQNMGNHPEDEGKLYSEYGRSDCPLKDKGIMTKQPSDTEFLGLCEGNTPNKQGIKVEKKDNTHPILRVCSGDCFENSGEIYKDGKVIDTTKTVGEGLEVKFQKFNQ